MALKGDLASVDLAQVFQMLALNQKVGMLSIQSPKAWKSLYFDQRGVTLYFNEHTMLDRVLAQMVRTDRASEDDGLVRSVTFSVQRHRLTLHFATIPPGGGASWSMPAGPRQHVSPSRNSPSSCSSP